MRKYFIAVPVFIVAIIWVLATGTIAVLAGIRGQNLPTSGTNDTATGTIAWLRPETITNYTVGSTTQRASAACAGTTNYLKGQAFNMNVPDGATVTGIQVLIHRGIASGETARDARVSIVKSDGTVGSTNKATTTLQWTSDLSQFRIYGGPGDLWGETWTAADVNDADFGVVLSALLTCTGP